MTTGHENESQYLTLDSGQRDEFETGSRRDVETNKPRVDLLDWDFLCGVSDQIPFMLGYDVDTIHQCLASIPDYVTHTKQTVAREIFTQAAVCTIAREYGTQSENGMVTMPPPRVQGIPTGALLRLAGLLGRGAEKYGDNNWRKGQPLRRTYSSLMRHFLIWADGRETTEDHFAAVLFNLNAMWHAVRYHDRLPGTLFNLTPMGMSDAQLFTQES